MSVILGKKIGMTSIINENGDHIPCTVIQAGPCPVVQIRSNETDGYTSVQIGFEPAKEKHLTKPLLGHFKKAGISPLRHLKEFRMTNIPWSVGDTISVDEFKKGDKIKISGTGKGKGFQGVVRRHHFSGVGQTTHGQSDRQRAPGSIGSSSFPSRVFKGLRMAGRMGGKRISIRNLEILETMKDSNLLLVRGSIPGAINSIVEIVKL
jgi:large subunit ribosomal protein L3